jgi:hypothetical protein
VGILITGQTIINCATLGVATAMAHLTGIVMLAMEATGIGKQMLFKEAEFAIPIVPGLDIRQPMQASTAQVVGHNVPIVGGSALGARIIQVKALVTLVNKAITCSTIEVISVKILLDLILLTLDLLFHKLNVVIPRVLFTILKFLFHQQAVILGQMQLL